MNEGVKSIREVMAEPVSDVHDAIRHIQDRVRLATEKFDVAGVREFFTDTTDSVNIRVRQLTMARWFITYQISAYLFRIQTENLWRRPDFCCEQQDEYSGFYRWVWGELGINERTARYLRDVAEKLYTLEADGDTVKNLFKMGWPKAYQILRVVTDQKQLKDWYEIAVHMTENEVKKTVRLALEKPETVQAELDGKVVRGDIKDPIDYRVKFREASNFGILKKAQAVVERKMGVKNEEEFLSVVCAHYVATALPGMGEEIPVEIEYFLQALEERYGVCLEVVVPQLEEEDEL